MIRTVLTAAALCASCSALAQVAPTYNPAAGAGGQVDTTVNGPNSGVPTSSTPANPATPAAPAQISSVVDSEFPVYDADKSGVLSKAEFTKWISALKTEELKASGKTMTQAQIGAWAGSAFASADADKSANVTKGELTAYLGG